MKTLFVPTDFSSCATNAVRMAASIARKLGAKIYLFHTIDTPTDWIKVPVTEEANYPETRAKITYAKQRLGDLAQSDFLDGIEVVWELHFNESVIEALNTASCLNTDLIVMGTHGTSTFTRFVLGSNTQKITRLANCPVLTINEHVQKFDIQKIVIASSFQDQEGTEQTLQMVMDLEGAFDAKVCLLKVDGLLPDKTFNSGIWEKLVKENYAEKAVISIDPFSTVDEGIIKYAVNEKADLIVITSHGRKGILRLLMGSIAETVVNFSPVPVLVTHYQGARNQDIEEQAARMAEGLSSIR